MKSKVKMMAFAILAVCSLSVSAEAAFSDVNSTAPYADAVEYVSSKGIITGYSDGTFHPNNLLTRGQMAALICRMLGETNNLPTDGSRFSDIPRDHWANGYIVKAASLGIISGYADGTFRPNHVVTYEQAVKMIVSSTYGGTEASRLGGYPNGYLAVAKKYGLLNGVTATKGTAITRADIAMMIWNFYTGKNPFVEDGETVQSATDILDWITQDKTYWQHTDDPESGLNFRNDDRFGYWNTLEMLVSHFSMEGDCITFKFLSLDTDEFVNVTYRVYCFTSQGKKMMRLDYVGAGSNLAHLGSMEQYVAGVYVQQPLSGHTEAALYESYMVNDREWGSGEALDHEKMLSDGEVYERLVAHYRKGTADEPGDGITVWEGGSSETRYYETQARCGVPGNPYASQPLYWITVDKTSGVVIERNVITRELNTYNLLNE